MESETQYEIIENEEQFWNVLERILSDECTSHDAIDDALRSYLTLTVSHSDHVKTEDDIRRCAFQLYSSPIFKRHGNYVRRQFVHCLFQEEEALILHVVTTLLLADAKEHEETFALLNEEGTFAHLIKMVSTPRQDGHEELHRQCMELLYEMARIQKITNDDLMLIDDEFICFLFDIIEQVSGDVEDPYHYPVIRVLLVLNEQFMVAAHDPAVATLKTMPLTNKVMKVLSAQGSRFKTFGENIILLLNREDETSLQLLTLKLLYLLFTTPPTYEYFYTNDLHVLVDILIRNLLDLPEEASSLRHTYLRVLYPLLEHTQLKYPPHYKQNELRKLMSILVGDQASIGADSPSFSHFEEADETTKRLVLRCQSVTWLRAPEEEEVEPLSPSRSDPLISSPTKSMPPALPAPRKLRKRTVSKSSGSGSDFLVPKLESARQSSLSVAEMAVQREKPGVLTPSRNPSVKHGLRAAMFHKKEKPPPPKARRSASAKTILERPSDAVTDRSDSTAVTGHQQSGDHQLTGSEHVDDVPKTAIEGTKQIKRPPPAPKARRWRGRRIQGSDSGSVDTSNDNMDGLVKSSPVSPSDDVPARQALFASPDEKTLAPLAGPSGPTDKKSKRISSVSAALEQAQAQALQDLQQTFEGTTIEEEVIEGEGVGQASHGQAVARRAVLAPPGSAPRRDVPGPEVELGKSPFLGQEEESSIERMTPADVDFIEEESEDEWN